MSLKRIADRGLGAEPPEALGVWGQSPQKLGEFLEKQAILMPLDHIPYVLFRTISKN